MWGARHATARPALLVTVVLLLGAEASAAPVADAGARSVRILLGEGRAHFDLRRSDAPTQRVRARGARVQVGAGPPRQRWESPSPARFDVLGAHFEGRLRVEVDGSGGLRAVAVVPLEDYVAGTVASEMPSGWPPAALEAQAVVSRTYALRALGQPAAASYDLSADTSHQVFGAAAEVAAAVQRAVAATRGEFLAYEGEPILAAFHSASGGRTASAREVWGRSLPYLVSRPVENEDDAPSTYWRAAISRTTLRRALETLSVEVGRVERVGVVERWPSGRVREVEVRGDGGRARISGRELRRALGLDVVKSTLFEVREDADEIVIAGSGHGHGVGLSQWGARAMALRGADHREILRAFYPGTRLVRVDAPQGNE